MSIQERHRSITVRGIVCPSGWDEENQVSRVSIFTFDEDEYEIEPGDAGEYLLGHTGLEVAARGQLLAGTRRRKIMRVKSFTVFGVHPAEPADAPSETSPAATI